MANSNATQGLPEDKEVAMLTGTTEVKGGPIAVAEAVAEVVEEVAEEVVAEAAPMVLRPVMVPTRHLKPRIDNSEDLLRPHTGVDSLKSPPELSSTHQLNFCQQKFVG